MKLKSANFSPPPVMPSATNSLLHSDGSVLRVYTDIPQVEELLTRPDFTISMYQRAIIIHLDLITTMLLSFTSCLKCNMCNRIEVQSL